MVFFFIGFCVLGNSGCKDKKIFPIVQHFLQNGSAAVTRLKNGQKGRCSGCGRLAGGVPELCSGNF
jgi:hypothetical protein